MTKSVSQTKKKPVKEYYCPYCGKEFKNSEWTYDHIIPLGMGGPKKNKILSCTDCNQKIGIKEQIAIHAPSISSRIIDLEMQGYRIYGRRKSQARPFRRSRGIADGKLVKFYHNFGDENLSLVFYGKPLGEQSRPEKEDLLNSGGVARVIFDEDTDEEGLAFISLVSKIFLGIGFRIWGDSFAQNKFGEKLRENLWNIKQEDILDIDESAHHAIWKIDDDEDPQYSEYIQNDALDNTPDTTVCFFKSENMYFGLINILGKLESSIRFGNIDEFNLFDDNDEGVVIIAGSTKNQMKIMTLHEYEKYKTDKYTEKYFFKGNHCE
jgi:hypothetical protein